MANKYYFSTRDLLVMAVLGSLGGVMSTYVGYLANTINHLVGVPYGAGQVVGGLHVLWMVLVVAITGKKGSGALGGLVKGFVEFVSGSRLGTFVVLLSLVEGAFTELGYWPLRKYRTLAYVLAGGVGSFANVLTFQLAFQAYDNLYLFGAVGLLAFASGALFAGYFTGGIMGNLEDAGIVRREKEKKGLLTFSVPKAFALALAVAIAFSAIYYFALVQMRDDPLAVRVTGSVARPQDYYLPAYSGQFVTITAKLDGQYKHFPEQNYTGLPVRFVLQDARAQDSATKVDVVGFDGYRQTFNLSDVRSNDDLLLNITDMDASEEYVWLIARGYPGGMWVRKVKLIHVY